MGLGEHEHQKGQAQGGEAVGQGGALRRSGEGLQQQAQAPQLQFDQSSNDHRSKFKPFAMSLTPPNLNVEVFYTHEGRGQNKSNPNHTHSMSMLRLQH